MFTVFKILLLFFSPVVFAELDVTGATSGIAEGIEAVSSILGALLLAYGIFLGFKLPVNYLRYGNFSGVEKGDDHYYRDESGEWAWGEDDSERGTEYYEEHLRKQDIVDAYWLSESSSGVDNIDFYEWAEKEGIPVDDIDPDEVY